MENKMRYSKHIEHLRRRLVATGVKVELYAKLPSNIAGKCSYTPKLIQIDCCTGEDALITLAHEEAHWLDYLWHPLFYRRGKFRKRKKAREVTAYLLGWKILREQRAPISKEQWREAHYYLLNSYNG